MKTGSVIPSFVLLLIGWPLISSTVLLGLSVLSGLIFSKVTYSENIDMLAIFKMLAIVLSYILSFAIGGFLFRSSARAVSKSLMIISMIGGLSSLLWWRLLSIAGSHIDCGDVCANSVFPRHLDFIAGIITFVALCVTGFFLFIYLRKPDADSIHDSA